MPVFSFPDDYLSKYQRFSPNLVCALILCTPVTTIQRKRLGTTNAVENDDVIKICSVRKWFILAIYLIFLGGYFAQLQESGITFYRYICREICS